MTMTEAQALELPGRELDAMVAEAMGWHEGMTREEWPYWFSDDDGCICPRTPSFSTEINPAMDLVEWARGEGHGWQITGYKEPGMWWATIFPKGEYRTDTYGIGTFPFAVTLAFLKVKGVIE